MGRPIKYPFAHLHKTNNKEYNRLIACEYRKRNRKPEKITPHLLLTHLTELPEDVKPIPEWPTYYASEDGRIFRDNRETAKHGHGKIIELTQRWNPKVKYYQVQPYMPNGKRKLMYTHRMVLAAFTGEMKHDMYVNHKNFDRSDNSAKNLEWVTFNENIHHYATSDTVNYNRCNLTEGRKLSNTKYSQYKSQIKDLMEMGHKPVTIADVLQIPVGVVYHFKHSAGFNFY
jgi:hypothetical protein